MRRTRSARRSRGFTLVEVLVGVAIGMIGLLVMFKTIAMWDSRTRASVAGGDAQVSGTLATYALERDLRLAGMGFGTADTWDMGCVVTGFDAVAGAAINMRLMPVEIIDNDGTNTPDQINVLYGNSPFFPLKQEFTASTGGTKKARSRNGFKRGDAIVVTNNNAGGLPGTSTCALMQVTDDTAVDNLTLGHATGIYPDYYASAPRAARYNDAAASTVFAAGNMYSLGPAPQYNQWTVVNNDTLSVVDGLRGVTSDVAEGVVTMKAAYGIDADADKHITAGEWTKAPPIGTDWRDILAIRVAVLVRSRNFEKPASGPDAQSYTAVIPPYFGGAASFVMTNVDGTPDTNVFGSPNNWRYYRYRLYERVIPIRNMLWGTTPP